MPSAEEVAPGAVGGGAGEIGVGRIDVTHDASAFRPARPDVHFGSTPSGNRAEMSFSVPGILISCTSAFSPVALKKPFCPWP